MKKLLVAAVTALWLAGAPSYVQAQSPRGVADEVLKSRVEAALAAAADVPGRQITVAVRSGVVTLAGKVASDSMRGVPYPGATLQQSVGAIVRAVPGVKDIRFSLQVQPPAPPAGRGAPPPAPAPGR